VAPTDLYYLLVIVLVSLSGRCPSRLKRLLVSGIARVAYSCSIAKRDLMDCKVRTALPGLDAGARARIVKGAFHATWREMFSYVPTRGERAAVCEAELHGADHLRAALAAGRGAIVWTSAGFGHRLTGVRVLHAEGFLTLPVHGPNSLGAFLTNDATATWVRRALVRPFFERCERTVSAETITLSHTRSVAVARELRRRVEANAILWITGDGKEGLRFVPIDFCGMRERFATGMVTLARACGAPILPLFCVDGENGRIRVVIEPPLRIAASGQRDDAIESTIRQYARLLERYVRRHPEQYRNWHLLGADSLPA
jgi:lauroyl/myristoyl acyltransferase